MQDCKTCKEHTANREYIYLYIIIHISGFIINNRVLGDTQMNKELCNETYSDVILF